MVLEHRQIFFNYDTSVESVKSKVTAHTKQIYRTEILLFNIVNEHEINMKSNTNSDSRVSRGGSSVSSTMTDYCARFSLQIKPS